MGSSAHGDVVVDQGAFGIVLRRAPGYRGMDVFFTNLLDGMDARLRSHDSHIELLIVTTAEQELDALARWSADGLVAAVVIADLQESDPRPALCRELGLPAVSLGTGSDGVMSGVVVDNGGAARLAVDFLVGAGHQRLARVSGPARLRHTKERDSCFAEQAAGHAGVACSILEGDYTTESGYDCTERLLGLDPRPTAILYDNDAMAVAGLEAAQDAGLEVPRDLSILAWDDSALSRL
ncbi:MAG: LacI family DNA-binding transcriptional regulator, partial [Arachnia sp.]